MTAAYIYIGLVSLYCGLMTYLYLDQVRIAKYLSDNNNKLRNLILLKDFDIASFKKQLADTKAELEQYKNHNDNA